jgi:hypothetical protein
MHNSNQCDICSAVSFATMNVYPICIYIYIYIYIYIKVNMHVTSERMR